MAQQLTVSLQALLIFLLFAPIVQVQKKSWSGGVVAYVNNEWCSTTKVLLGLLNYGESIGITGIFVLYTP